MSAVMDEREVKSALRRYQVKVGHAVVTVSAADESDAIREARRRFSLEMPRLWDMIQGLEDSRFEVSPMQ